MVEDTSKRERVIDPAVADDERARHAEAVMEAADRVIKKWGALLDRLRET